MVELLKRIIKTTPFYYYLRIWVVKRKANDAAVVKWERSGRPVPPPHIVKQRALTEYASKYGLKIFVETGTYYGDMVEAMKLFFTRLYSIELSKELFKKAKGRFKKAKHVEIIHGDSGIELMKLMNKIDEPALFWLDGHYSSGETAKGENETPIFKELGFILNAPERRHVIIIDDARLFGSVSAYPTMDKLTDFIKSIRHNLEVVVQDDSIRITPK